MPTKAKDQQEPEVEEVEGEVVDEDAVEQVEPVEETPAELAVAIREEQAVAVQAQTYLPTPKEWEAMTAMAVRLCQTEFVPESYRGKPDTVLAAIATGREMGIGPMQSLRDIYMLDGRPTFSAHLLLAKLRAGGIKVIESEASRDRAFIKAQRLDTGEIASVEFTFEEASAITYRTRNGTKKLVEKDNWKNYQADMLWARAVSRLARRLGSDLMGGLVYTKEEVEDFGDEGGYGVGEGYGATTERPFNPGRDLHPNAVRASTQKELVAQLNEIQSTLAGDLDWPSMLEEAAAAKVGPREGRTAEQRVEVLKRWANSLARMLELAEASDIYQPELGLQSGEQGDSIIIEGIRFGFEHELSAPLPKIESEGDAQAENETEAAEEAPGEQVEASESSDDEIGYPETGDQE